MPRNEVSAAAATTEQEVKKTRPVTSTRQFQDTDDAQIPQGRSRVQKSRGPARKSLDPEEVERAERMPDQNKLEELKFMEEVVTVMLHESTDPADDPNPLVQVNGRSQYFIRGVDQQVKRKFVERLARARRTRYSQKTEHDDNGVPYYRNVKHTALRFPFVVKHDPSGDKGRAWLDAILNSPA